MTKLIIQSRYFHKNIKYRISFSKKGNAYGGNVTVDDKTVFGIFQITNNVLSLHNGNNGLIMLLTQVEIINVYKYINILTQSNFKNLPSR